METARLQAGVRWDQIALAGLTLGAAVWLAMHLRLMGFRIDQPQIGLDYAVGIFWWSVIALGLACVNGQDQRLLQMAWLTKFFVVLVAMLFYEQRYGLDAYWYFKAAATGYHPFYEGIDWREEWFRIQDAKRLSEQYKIGEGTQNMIRLTMLVSTVTGPYYHALKVVFAFFGLLGSWAFYRAVVVTLGRPVPAAFYCLALFPSILFWSSILGKDPIMFMLLGVCAYGAARILVRGEPVGILILAAGLLLAFNLRPWTALMAGGTLAITLFFRRGHALLRWALILITLPALTLGWEPVKEAYHVNDLSSLQDLFVMLTEGQDVQSEWTTYNAQFGGVQRTAGATDVVEKIQSGNVAGALPVIIFTGLFRPLPFEARNAFMAVAALENTVILLLVLIAVKRIHWDHFREPLVNWSIFLSLLWAAFHGAILLANFGAGVRYRLQVLPFMVIFLFLVLHPAGLALRDARGGSRAMAYPAKPTGPAGFPAV